MSSVKTNINSSTSHLRKRNGLKIAFLNIVSLRKHKSELELVLHNNDIDVIGLSETRLAKTVPDSVVSIEGYRIYRNDRDANGGGVAMYVKESLPEATIKVASNKLELIALEVSPSNHARPFHIVCWYRPPTAGVDYTAFENLREILKNLDKEDKEVILIGDTNCDFKNAKNANAKKLKLIYSEYQLEQLIKGFTRVAMTTTESGEQKVSKTLIDHFSSTNPKYIIEADVIRTGMVDHYLVYGIRKINAWRRKGNKQKIVESRNMKKYDKMLFRQDLQQIDWETILSPFNNDPVSMAATFQEIFESILNLHAPVRKKRVRSQFAPWLTASLKNLMMERDMLKQEAEKYPEKWPAYKRLRNQVTREMRNAIRDYYHGLIDENIGNPKKMWKTINKVLDKNENSVKLSSVEVDGKCLTRERDILKALNQHFVSVGPNLAKKIVSKPGDDCLQNIKPELKEMEFKTVDDVFILNAIKQLKSGKAAGPDKVPTAIVKDVGDLVSKPLMMIFNSSLKNGIFPDIWKLARVTPIFKSGAKKDVNNYRPISVISIFSRILERIVHDQMFDFLLENNVITKNQSAFRKLYSTITSLICSTDFWYENIDSKKLNLTIFLDLKKAFDTVDHKIMVKKLCRYGIRGNAGNWFQSYLDHRKQFCSVNGQRSMTSEVTCGIPQGSCLGPLLFIIYLNDFEKCLKFSQASIYADDTNVTIASDDVEKLVLEAQQELLNLSEWMRINKLSPNPAKTEYMIIGHSRKVNALNISNALTLNGSDIKRVTKTKSLGVTVDENLKWEEQYKTVKGKVFGGLASLKKLRNIIPQTKLCSVYYAIVESHLRYANEIWGSLPKTKLDTLQRLQDRARSIIESARFKDNWSCDWLSVENIIRFDRSVMTYKIMNKLSPESLWDKFQQRSSQSNYATRYCRDLQIPRLNTEYAKKSYYYSAMKVWNNIPVDIRELPTISRFKKELKEYLKS